MYWENVLRANAGMTLRHTYEFNKDGTPTIVASISGNGDKAEISTMGREKVSTVPFK
jgi:hypothetical protein